MKYALLLALLLTGCAASSVDENKQLVRRFYEEVVNTGDVERIEEFVSPDYVEIFGGVRHSVGLEGARAHVLGSRSVYPDLTLTLERQIAEGDWVVTCMTMRGTHSGSWLGIEPTGEVLEVTTVNVDRVVDGRIVEHGGAVDLLVPLLEAGAVQPTARD